MIMITKNGFVDDHDHKKRVIVAREVNFGAAVTPTDNSLCLCCIVIPKDATQ